MPTTKLVEKTLATVLSFERSASLFLILLFFIRVDELVKAMYTPSNSKQIEEK